MRGALVIAVCLLVGVSLVLSEALAQESTCTGQNLGDADGDGFDSFQTRNPTFFCGDCNPYDANIHPMADDWEDNKDNDCDGLVDEDGFPRGELVDSGCSQCRLRDGGGCSVFKPMFNPLAFLAFLLYLLRLRRIGGQR